MALYATTPREMAKAMQRVADGDVVQSDVLVHRSKGWGSDPRHGWNEVAKVRNLGIVIFSKGVCHDCRWFALMPFPMQHPKPSF